MSKKIAGKKVSVLEKYSLLKPGHLYILVKEGYDYYVLKFHGTNICVPKNIIDFKTNKHNKSKQNEEDSWEMCVAEYWNFDDLL